MNFAGTTLFCNSLISILSSIVSYFTSDVMMSCLSVYNYANFFFVACFIFFCLFFFLVLYTELYSVSIISKLCHSGLAEYA